MKNQSDCRRTQHASSFLLVACVVASATSAHGVVTTREYGIDFATIGDPGNRPVNALEGPEFYNSPMWPKPTLVGSVGYEYRLSKTEITASQWLEFVQAYAPYHTGFPNTSAFTGQFIYTSSTLPSGVPLYQLSPGTEQFPTDMSWRFAARYCNWLHNGKASTPEAFESGAYETSTFTQNAQGWYNDQERRSEGARFWVPSIDEMVKGMHWDPDKHGPGEGGYWYYPTTSDDVPVSGLPGTPGAQTATGLQAPPFWQAVGLYPDVQSPWGLLDGTGGASEWLENVVAPGSWRRTDGTQSFSGISPENWLDTVDRFGSGIPNISARGVRIATLTPSPFSICVFALGASHLTRRNRT